MSKTKKNDKCTRSEKMVMDSEKSHGTKAKMVEKSRKERNSSEHYEDMSLEEPIKDIKKLASETRGENRRTSTAEYKHREAEGKKNLRKSHKNSNAEDSEKERVREEEKKRKESRRLKKLLQKTNKTGLCEIKVESKMDLDRTDVRDEELSNKENVEPEKPRFIPPPQHNNDEIVGMDEHETELKQNFTESTAEDQNSAKKYFQNHDLTSLSTDEIDTFLSKNSISIIDTASESLSLRPIIKFSYLPITDPGLLASFRNFETPTPIQAVAWPYLFSGRDVIGIAETGSGKTMAFAVPCVKKILSLPLKKQNKAVRAVIISPTRELTIQNYEQILDLCKTSSIRAVSIYGGVSKDEQRKALKTADIVVATPGRLNDLIHEGYADISRAEYVVLDEADRMLDKGFEEEIRKIIKMTAEVGTRQTIMFTATWPESIQSLASTFLKSPVKIIIGNNKTGDLRANNRIVQKVEVIDPRSKENRLLQILKQYQSGSDNKERIIVFALYKKEATRIEGFIRSKGFRVVSIHGDLSQQQRIRSLEAFKKGNTPILVATDVAARGLDIPSVKLVLNLTFPLTVEDYVHRIGRTGRAGKEGLSITLFTEHDKAQSGALINVLKAAKQEIPDALLKFGTTVKRKEHDGYGAFTKDVDMTKKAKKIKFDQ